MDTLKLGQIIKTPQQRDAIHIAVAPVLAEDDINPGQHIGVDEKNIVRPADGIVKAIGIADPYLRQPLKRGQEFWVFLYPGSIVGLRHDWFHPAFVTNPSADQSEAWIRQFAQSVGLDYETMMSGAREWVASRASGVDGEYLCFGGLLEGESVPDEFWPHFESVTGTKVPEEHQGSFFTCSC